MTEAWMKMVNGLLSTNLKLKQCRTDRERGDGACPGWVNGWRRGGRRSRRDECVRRVTSMRDRDRENILSRSHRQRKGVRYWGLFDEWWVGGSFFWEICLEDLRVENSNELMDHFVLGIPIFYFLFWYNGNFHYIFGWFLF